MSVRMKSILILIMAVILGGVSGNLAIYRPSSLLYALMFLLLIGITGICTYLTDSRSTGTLTGLLFWICILLGYEIKIGWMQWHRLGIHPDFASATATLIGMAIVGVPTAIVSSLLVQKQRWTAFFVSFIGGAILFFLAMKLLLFVMVHYRFFMNTF